MADIKLDLFAFMISFSFLKKRSFIVTCCPCMICHVPFMVQEVFKFLIKVQSLSWIHMHKYFLAIIRL